MWTQSDRPRLETSPGFLLLIAVVFWLDEGIGLLPWCLLSCLIHELGHVAAAAACGGRIERLSLTVVGAELSFSYHAPLSYGQDSLVALAGPAANLAAGGLFLALGWEVAAALSLGIGAFNLLPVQPLDGGRVVHGLLAERLDPDWADRLMTAASGCIVGVLVGIGVVIAAYYANATLLLTALWLLTGVLRHGDRDAGSGFPNRKDQKREQH